MSDVRADDELVSPSTSKEHYDDSALEGVAAHVKLLLKLIHDHREACDNEKNGRRRMLRVATMVTILDSIRDRIQKAQSFGNKSDAELRRCNTEPNRGPNDKKPDSGAVTDYEYERMRRELATSVAARKSLQIMCSSLGKEKEIMAGELSRKAQELSGMEELINDLKAQNDMLLRKVQDCAYNHKEKKGGGGVGGGRSGAESQVVAVLQERNKTLSEQLLKSLDGYRSIKRKMKAAQDENCVMRTTMDEMGGKIVGSLERIRSFKERVSSTSSSSSSGARTPLDVREEIEALEGVFEGFRMMVEKCNKKKGECVQPKGEISARKSPLLA